MHRVPSHSVMVAAVAFIPFFIIYRKKAIPYFLALISHSLIGDFFVGGKLELFWPVSNAQFGFHELGSYYISILSPINIALEVTLFIVASLVLYKTGDWKVFFTADKTNLVLIISIATVLLPATIGYPFDESLLLTASILAFAHIFYLVLFSIAVLKTAKNAGLPIPQKVQAPQQFSSARQSINGSKRCHGSLSFADVSLLNISARLQGETQICS